MDASLKPPDFCAVEKTPFDSRRKAGAGSGSPVSPPKGISDEKLEYFFSPHVTPKYQPTLQHGSFFLSAWNLCQEFRRIIKVRFSSYLGNLHGRGFLAAFVACSSTHARVYGAIVTRNVGLDIWKRETICLAATRSFLFIVNRGYVYKFIGSLFNGRNNSEKVYRVSLEIDVARPFVSLCISIETLWIYNGAYLTISIIFHELYSLVSRAFSRIFHSDFFRYEFAIWFVGSFGVKKTLKIESFMKSSRLWRSWYACVTRIALYVGRYISRIDRLNLHGPTNSGKNVASGYKFRYVKGFVIFDW